MQGVTLVLSLKNAWGEEAHFLVPLELPLEPDIGKRLLGGNDDNSVGFVRIIFKISKG